MAKRKKRVPPRTKQLWNVVVAHRDYEQSVNDRNKQIWMTTTTLLITVEQPRDAEPDIDLALAASRRFLNHNRRQYAFANIRRMTLQGQIDN